MQWKENYKIGTNYKSNVKSDWRCKGGALVKRMLKCWELYAFLVPAIILIVLFAYVPIYGVQLAFKDLTPGATITQSPWVGLKHFNRFFALPNFKTLIGNTVKISIISNLIGFPLPIILALMLNQVENQRFKKLVQTVTYVPHLFSIVVVISITQLMCSTRGGIINIIIQKLGGDPVFFFGEPKYVLPIYLITAIWQGLGYNAIVYISALSSVDPSQIEAARIDGCGKLRLIWNIELPAISSTIITMLILVFGQAFNIGADKMLLLQTNLNISASEVISTYVYKVGLLDGQYGFSTAVNLFNTLVNFACLMLVNTLSRKFSETSLF